jgi:hypothetical protein
MHSAFVALVISSYFYQNVVSHDVIKLYYSEWMIFSSKYRHIEDIGD